MIKAYIKFWKNWLTFDGKSSRSDYWWVFLANSIIRAIILLGSVIALYSAVTSKIDITNPDLVNKVTDLTHQVLLHPTAAMWTMTIIGAAFSLLIAVPVTTLTARRLRDAGFSGNFAYPLLVIYLAEAVMQFVSLPALNFLSGIFVAYSFAILVLCMRKSTERKEIERF